MGKNSNTRNFVSHPRFGERPIPSGHEYSAAEVEQSFWLYSSVKYFIDTVIPADITKQNYSTFPRTLYVDIEEQCQICHRPFLFFAKEQKHWFEELRFYVDAHCKRCIDCRKKDQEVRRMQVTYEKLLSMNNRTRYETATLKNIALELFQLGYIKDKSKIDSLG